MTTDVEAGVAGARCYRGDCGAVVLVAVGCPDAGRPHACSCGAELYPQIDPAPSPAAITAPGAGATGGALGATAG